MWTLAAVQRTPGPLFSGMSPQKWEPGRDLWVQPALRRLGAQAQEAGLGALGAGKCVPLAPSHCPLPVRPGISSASWGSLQAHPLPSAGLTPGIREGYACTRVLHSWRGAESTGRKALSSWVQRRPSPSTLFGGLCLPWLSPFVQPPLHRGDRFTEQGLQVTPAQLCRRNLSATLGPRRATPSL